MKGYKRHAGAIVLIALYALRIFGVDVPDETETLIASLGAGVFGLGWLHRAVDGPHKS